MSNDQVRSLLLRFVATVDDQWDEDDVDIALLRKLADEGRVALHLVVEPVVTFDLRAFSAENLERCTSVAGFGHPLELWSLSDWMTAALGELGEAANVVKKLNRVRDGITGNVKSEAELRQDLADELADAFIYLDLLAQAAAVDLPKAIREKFDRTSEKIGYVAGGEVRS